MAKKERQKRSARQARQAERAEREAIAVQNAVARGEDPEAAKAALNKSAEAKKPKTTASKPGFFKRIGNWFAGVAQEMRRVVWPTRKELASYSAAVIGLLIAFGLVVWAVDTGVVAGLVQYAKLRPGYQEPSITMTDSTAAAEATTSEATTAAATTEGAAEATTAPVTGEAATTEATSAPATEAATTPAATTEAATQATTGEAASQAAPAEPTTTGSEG